MVKIILIGGFGRMGLAIQEIALHEPCGAEVCCIVSESTSERQNTIPIVKTIEEAMPYATGAVIIDFSTPSVSMHVAKVAHMHCVPLVIGTTGFSDEQRAQLSLYAEQSPLLLSSNMSKGITTILKLIPQLVTSLGEEYDVEIVETHHKRKKDAPSGTAISLAQAVADAKEWELSSTACCCREGIIGERPKKEIGIQSVRGGGVAGIHTLSFIGEDERIEITHHAHSRSSFARGAIHAGVWLHTKKAGALYSMLDTI